MESAERERKSEISKHIVEKFTRAFEIILVNGMTHMFDKMGLGIGDGIIPTETEMRVNAIDMRVEKAKMDSLLKIHEEEFPDQSRHWMKEKSEKADRMLLEVLKREGIDDCEMAEELKKRIERLKKL